MPRPTDKIELEIAAIEARLASGKSFVRTAGADGVSVGSEERYRLEQRLDHLYNQLDRIRGRAPIFVRGKIRGLG